MTRPRAAAAPLGLALAALGAGGAHAEPRSPERVVPFVDPADVPLPDWARTAAPKKDETPLSAYPGGPRRAVTWPGARLRVFGVKRAPGCVGRWLALGPYAWGCSDGFDLSDDAPILPTVGAEGLPFRWFFAGPGGAMGFASLEHALEDAPAQELEPGFAVATVEERRAHGETWVRSRRGRWFALHELVPARPSPFAGERLDAAAVPPGPGPLAVGWVVAERAVVRDGKGGARDRAIATLERFERVTRPAPTEAETSLPKGLVAVRFGDGREGVARASDLAFPTRAEPPAQVTAPHERWIDVELATQTLVAYEGAVPVFATLVSTGRGGDGAPTRTPRGVNRIWVKLATSTMDNLERDDVEKHYAIEDVPYVQFFDKDVALHAAFWHRDFGWVHSHGCVNLSPADAATLFAFTGPRLVPGTWAVLPTPADPGTVVRVR